MKLDNILVPIVFSKQSRWALLEADNLALNANASITMLHVHQVSDVAIMEFGFVQPNRSSEEVEELATRRMKIWAQELKTAEHKISFIVKIGSPAQQIIDISEQFDQIVMSTHGRTGVTHFLLGSTAERVVQGSKCSVLIVKNR